MIQQSPGGPRPSAQDDLYTVLLVVAAVLLLGGTIFLLVRSQILFGSILPTGGS